MTAARIDAHQRAALKTLTTAWEPASVLIERTCVYGSPRSLSMTLGHLRPRGLVEGRYQSDAHRETEWRITEAGLEARGPVVAESAP